MSTRLQWQATKVLLLILTLLMPSVAVSSPRGPQDIPPGVLKKTAQAPPSDQVVKEPPAFGIEDATPVKLRTTKNISSADARVGDTIDFEVLEDLKVKDVIVIPRGGTAWGTVTEAQSKRRMGRGGKLGINIDNVRLSSGEKAALRAVKETAGGGHKAVIALTSIVLSPAAPLIFLIHGKDIVIPKGTEITAYVNGDVSLDPKKFAARSEVDAENVQPPSDVSEAHDGKTVPLGPPTVEIKSTPDGAEITVDGKFVGSTRSSVRLEVGEHKIQLRKPGFKTWERTMSVSASATIDATLEKE
jgi:hypothetical protein